MPVSTIGGLVAAGNPGNVSLLDCEAWHWYSARQFNRDLLPVFISGTDWMDEIKVENCHGNAGKAESSSLGSQNTLTLEITQVSTWEK